MPAASSNTNPSLDSRVAQVSSEFEAHARVVNSFIAKQEETNNSLFNLIRAQGTEMNDGLNRIQSSLGERGRLTPSNIGVMLSLVSSILFFGHWYVSSTAGNIRTELKYAIDNITTVNKFSSDILLEHSSNIKKVSEILTEERIRSREADAINTEKIRQLRSDLDTATR